MKRKMMLIVLTGLLVICMTACSGKQDTEGSVLELDGDKQQSSVEEETDKVEEVVTDKEPELKEETTETADATVTIFFGNANADGFDTEDITIPEQTPSALLAELAKKNVLPAEVTVLNFTQLQVDGKNAIDLDLSNEYSSYIETRGTAGEKMSIGSICNTFLRGYNSECIRITVEGNVLTTGHREYPDYMTAF